jgi:hypothetical protein
MSPVDALKRIDSLIEDLQYEINANLDNRDEMLEAYVFYTGMIYKVVQEATPMERNLPA